jgi:hypothetical protein
MEFRQMVALAWEKQEIDRHLRVFWTSLLEASAVSRPRVKNDRVAITLSCLFLQQFEKLHCLTFTFDPARLDLLSNNGSAGNSPSYNKEMEISGPYNAVHVTHVGFNATTGEFTGLPEEWQTLLQHSGISKREQVQNPQVILAISIIGKTIFRCWCDKVADLIFLIYSIRLSWM